MKACIKAVRILILCFTFFALAGKGISVHAAEENDTTITVNVDALRVRQNPSLKAKRLGHVNIGNTLRYIDTVDDQWIAVEFNGEIAYVAAKYVTINCMGPAEEQIAVMQDADTEVVEILTAEQPVTEVAVEAQNVEQTSEVAPDTQQLSIEEAADIACTDGLQVTEDSTAVVASDVQEAVLEEEVIPLAAQEEMAEETAEEAVAETVVEDSYEVKLLAALIQCEAVGECYEGQVAVGAVVMNRVADPRFPSTIQEVIYQPGQFTPVKSGKVERVLNSGNINESCLMAAREAFSGVSNVGTCTRFRRGTREGGIVIQHHVFYEV